MDSPTAVPSPSTSSEMQLYKALDRANLLQYYDKFIAQGGDDLQQLCEAEEGEFFEIMELVGMSCKPLHVRRLQKVLHEFIADQGQFPSQTAQPPPPNPETPRQASPDYSFNVSSSSGLSVDGLSTSANKTFASLAGLSQYSKMTFSPKFSQTKSPVSNGENASLNEEHIINVRNASMAIFQEMDMQSFPLPKKIPQEMVHILEMANDHPQREEEIRKWAPIYGRFDSKRKSEKPLSLHEVTVNEAACQLCLLEPNLLFMRDRLFPLARQVVRESGYQYKHGHSSRSNRDMVRMQGEEDTPYSKGQKTNRDGDPNTRTVQAELVKLRREERMNEITTQLNIIKENQANLKDKIALAKVDDNLQKVYDLQIELEKLTSQQLMLMTEQTDLIKRQRRSERYYGAKTKQPDEVRNTSELSPKPMELPPNEESSTSGIEAYPELSGEFYQTSTSNRTESPKPEGGRSSRRKGTPRSHHAFLKQTLIDEGLRLAQVFNNGGDEFHDSSGASSIPQQGYRIEADTELRQAYGIKDIPPNVNVADMSSDDVIKPEQMMEGATNGGSHFINEKEQMTSDENTEEAKGQQEMIQNQQMPLNDEQMQQNQEHMPQNLQIKQEPIHQDQQQAMESQIHQNQEHMHQNFQNKQEPIHQDQQQAMESQMHQNQEHMHQNLQNKQEPIHQDQQQANQPQIHHEQMHQNQQQLYQNLSQMHQNPEQMNQNQQPANHNHSQIHQNPELIHQQQMHQSLQQMRQNQLDMLESQPEIMQSLPQLM